MKKTNRDIDIIEKIQTEVNSVLELHKSASDDWYRNRFSSDEIEEKSDLVTRTYDSGEPLKIFD